MSYPYIERGEHRISLIEPFTIDNKLVTKFEAEHTIHWRTEECLYFKVQLNFTEWIGFSYIGSLNMLNQEYREKLYNLYEHYCWTHNNRNSSIMRECNHHLRRGDEYITHLIEDVMQQCECLQRNPSRNVASYARECQRQGRELNLSGCIGTYEPVETVSFNPTNYITRSDTSAWSDYAYYPMYGSSLFDAANRVVTLSGTGASRGHRASDVYIDDDCRTLSDLWHTDLSRSLSSDRQKSIIIHTYNYKPTYKKHYLDGEDETTTLLLGAEIEVDNGGETEEHAKEVLKIMNGKETWESEENIYCVHDGSLSKGLEFPTQPGSLAWHKTLPYKKMFKYLDKNGYQAHDTKTCGLHVHINRSFFGEHEAECIGKLMYILEKFNDEFSVIGRRDCRYAKMLGYNGEKCKELYQKGYSIKDKYNAINIMHKDTIEIRSFKSTLKYSTYINTLEFVEKLAHFVKTHTEEDIETMKWLDLYETFSKDLKTYYNERAEIEKQKKQEAPLKKTGTYGSISIDSIRSVTATDRDGHVIGTFNNPQNVTLTLSRTDRSEYVPITGTPITRTCVARGAGTINGNTIHSIDMPVIEYMDTTQSLRKTLRRKPKNNEIFYVFTVNESTFSTEDIISDYHYKASTNEIIVPERYRNKKIVVSYYTVADSNSNVLASNVTLSYNNDNIIHSTESKEDKEKEIKNLKKRLKTEKNYLTKIKIQKEITKLQNELKKQIKQEKKQNKTNKVS